MVQVRKSCFETNSSSIHAICIPPSSTKPTYIKFYVDSFGWEESQVCSPASYLYTAICDNFPEEEKYNEIMTRLKRILDKHNIEYDIIEPRWSKRGSGNRYLNSDDGYIDHCGDCIPLINELLEDEELLLRYLIDAEIFTGNDNNDSDFVENRANECNLRGYYVYWK